MNRIWRGGTQTRTSWFQRFATAVDILISAEVYDPTGTAVMYLQPYLNGSGTPDIFHRNFDALDCLEIWKLPTSLQCPAGYNFIDVGEAEFASHDCTLDLGLTMATLFQ